MELVSSSTTVKKSLVYRIITLVCLAGMLVGVGFSLFYFLYFEAIDYSKYTPSQFEDDQVALMEKYENTAKVDYFDTFKPYELANIAVNKLGQHEYAKSVAKGVVHAAISDQRTDSYYQKSKDTYFFENISLGFKQIYLRFYQTLDEVLQYRGNANAWNKTVDKRYNLTSFEDKWGRNLSRYSIFIVSSKTTLMDQTTKTKQDGKIYLSLELHPIYSVLRYVKQMMATSDMETPPSFHKMHLNLTLDEDLNLLHSRTEEKYDIHMYGINIPNASAYLDETLIYDVPEEVPTLDEACDYSPAESNQ